MNVDSVAGLTTIVRKETTKGATSTTPLIVVISDKKAITSEARKRR